MKLTLMIETGTLAGSKFELESGYFTIGRGERCNVRFDPLNERVMSKEHCFIEAKPDGFYLTDNQSTNGTLLNGENIQTSKLKSGDFVQFGKNGVRAYILIEALEGQNEQTQLASNIQIPQQNIVTEIQSEQTRLSPNFQFPNQTPTELQQSIQPTVFNPMQTPISLIQSPSQSPQNFSEPTQFIQQATSVNFRNSLTGLGAGSMPPQYFPEPETGNPLKYIGIALGILGLLFCLLLVFLITFLSLGPVTAVIATVVAFIPAFFYIIPFILIDRYDPEPLWLLALAFSWGALVSVVFSFFANTIVGIGAAIATNNPEIGDSVMAVVAAPIFEEGSKGMGLILLLIFFRKYFDDILDGIVFAGVIALGFATVENILYYGRGMNGAGIIGLVLLFIIRGVLSPFAHATFTSMTGIGCGIARETHNTAAKLLFPVVGYIIAVLLHALWNGMAVFAGYVIRGFEIDWVCESIGMGGSFTGLCSFLLGYGVLEVPLFIGFTIFTFSIMRRQNKILKEMLAIDVARGTIPQEHFNKATSIYHSIAWIIAGIGSGKFSARNKYIRTLGKLGLSYWHIQRATAAQGQTASFQQNPILREEVLKWREKV
jgi:RsiW-degrading membrane proteinase PrsW (M82 family)/pSer/pThr/pTyr-binding forkhead associated (FHA) protein